MSNWQVALKKHPEANFLQSEVWAKTNQLLGNQSITVDLGEDGFLVGYVKNAKRGRYLEIPGGPLIDWSDSKIIQEFKQKITQIAKEQRCVFVRFRPQLENTTENCRILAQIGARTAKMHLAAEHTVIIDLAPSEEELLANMRRQTRYEVRRAAKLGIEVTKDNSEEMFKEFQAVQAETAARQHFVPPDLKTLLAEREAFGDNAWIYKAIAGDCKSDSCGDPQSRRGPSDEARDDGPEERPQESSFESPAIAYGLILIDGNEAAYYEAASTDLNRKLPGAYALQWQVIRDLKKQGIKRYNLWGIAPPNQPNHRYAGVTTFKTGFGGKVVEYVPAQDLIIDSTRYKLNLVVESVRKKRRHL